MTKGDKSHYLHGVSINGFEWKLHIFVIISIHMLFFKIMHVKKIGNGKVISFLIMLNKMLDQQRNPKQLT